ncbi:cupin domain-containing protein [Streptomyces sp. NPDC059352]|uniref:cupin domain-containing protein n=1 Tax=Streptomyces sp. NPDC059352 TaxID=3346810 RepID=UPI0036932978
MDALAELLDGVRAHGAVFTRTVMSPRLSLRFASGARLSLLAVLDGRVRITPAGGEPRELGPGDIAVLRGPAPYTVAEDPAAPTTHVITGADYCARTARAVVAGEAAAPDPRTCGVDEAGSAVLVSGAYETGPAGPISGVREGRTGAREGRTGVRQGRTGVDEDRTGARKDRTGARKDRTGARKGRTGVDEDRSGVREERTRVDERLLGALPDLLVVPEADGDRTLLALLALVSDEVRRDRPGQQAVLDRLLDLLLVSTLRAPGSTARRPMHPRGTGRRTTPSSRTRSG